MAKTRPYHLEPLEFTQNRVGRRKFFKVPDRALATWIASTHQLGVKFVAFFGRLMG